MLEQSQIDDFQKNGAVLLKGRSEERRVGKECS